MNELPNPELSNIKDTVVFIFEEDTDPCKTKGLNPIGTGFVIGLALKDEPGKYCKFVVTNAHVLDGRNKVVLRLNDNNSEGTICFTADLGSTAIRPSDPSVDLIAFSIPDIPNYTPTFFDYAYVLGTNQLKTAEIEEGTEVVAIGFLNPYAGLNRNLPVMRFGKIALLTNERWVIPDSALPGQGYLVEIYNVSGSSGSPVVLQPSQLRVNRENQLQQRRIKPFIVGVIKGHPVSFAEVYEIKNHALSKKPDNAVAISSGVAIIEPGENLKIFLQEIAKAIEKHGHRVLLKEAF